MKQAEGLVSLLLTQISLQEANHYPVNVLVPREVGRNVNTKVLGLCLCF